MISRGTAFLRHTTKAATVVQENQLLAAMHALHSPAIPSQWAALSRDVALFGPKYVKTRLSNRPHLVPDVEGATGADILSYQ